LKALAGKTTLEAEYGTDKNDNAFRAINEEWPVESCLLRPGNIEKGESAKIAFKFLSPLRVFKK
jgi:hypothetical protein